LIAKFKYFEVMDAFLANRPATQPKVVIDSLCTSNADSDSDDSVKPAGSTTVGNGNSTAATVDLNSRDEPTVNVKQKPKESADLSRCEANYIKQEEMKTTNRNHARYYERNDQAGC